MTLPLSGIYKITNLKNGKIYVGQSQNVYVRCRQHIHALSVGHHPNKDMQKDWKTDYRNFRADVIELCPLTKLNEREEYWIKKLNTIEKGYNKGWVPYKRKTPKKPHYKQKRYHRSR